MSDGLRLDDALRGEDVSEAGLGDACFAGGRGGEEGGGEGVRGGAVPNRGLVLARGGAQFRVVRLGGPKVRKACGHAADPFEDGDVFKCRDSSVAPLLDLRVGSRR